MAGAKDRGGERLPGTASGSERYPERSPEWGHVGQKEIIATLTLFIAGKIFLTFPATMTERAKTSVWMVTTIGALVAVVGVLVIITLMNRFPDYSLSRVSVYLTGSAVGALLNLTLSAYFLAQASAVVREATETVIIGILPRTPLSVLIVVMLLVAAYGTYLGLETVSRTVWLLAPWLLALTAAIFLSDAKYMDFSRLTPVWGKSPPEIIKLGVIKSALYAEIVAVAFFYPALRRKKAVLAGTLTALGLSWFIITAVVTATVAVLGTTEASRTAFPTYFLARMIHFGRFVQRVEALFVFLWFFSATLKVTLFFYVTHVAISETLRLPNYRPLVPAMTVILYTVAFLAPSYIAVIKFEADVLRVYGSPVCFGIPLLLLGVSAITGKRQPDLGEKNRAAAQAGKGAPADAD
ncbi:MAG: GerAB/ArcD/ProY family transporter [Bacillota bacterium]